MRRLFACIGILVLFSALFCGCAAREEGTLYRIEGEYDPETGTLSATLDLTYRNDTGEELDELAFNLYGNAYREGAKYQPISAAYHSAYYDKLSYGGMKIASVDGAESWEVGGEDENLLVVRTGHIGRGETVRLAIDFSTTLAKVNHRLGIGETCVNLGNFYPVLCVYDGGWQACNYYNVGDPFYSECASYEVKLTFPKTYTLASSGREEAVSVQGDKKTVTLRLEHARDFAAVLSDSFSVLQATVNGVQISYYYTQDEDAQAHLSLIRESFSYFSEQFGAYPYETLSVAQTDFCFGGMEYPALTMINRNLAEESALYTIVHENAHQWWYAAVGNDQINHAWMDEGLAEYACVLFFESHDYGYTRSGVVTSARKAIRAYTGIYSQLFGKTDTAMDRPLSAFMSEYEYSNLVYNQGILLFDSLREAIGEKRFMSGLQEYYRKYSGKIASPEALISCFERTGVDVRGHFSSFLEGNAVI